MPRIHRDPVPLRAFQIRAAVALFDELPQWRTTDRALTELRTRIPDRTPATELLRVAVVNALYFTNIYALARMAEHVHAVMSSCETPAEEPDLVERLSVLPPRSRDEKPRNHLSFAAKYAHFFVDEER